MISNNRSAGFHEVESKIAVPSAPPGTNAGAAGGRGGRVFRRQESMGETVAPASEIAASASESAKPAASSAAVVGDAEGPDAAAADMFVKPSEAHRASLKKVQDDTASLTKWFSADADAAKNDEISVSDFRDACKALGVAVVPCIAALCENSNLSTSLRAISLLNTRAANGIKMLEDVKKAERDARQRERDAKAKALADAKKAKKDAEDEKEKNAAAILAIEASIMLNLTKGQLPIDKGVQKVSSEAIFSRYVDKGMQFQFGSAEFTGLRLFPDGTFEFKNGYKMEFSSTRKFVEQSEGLFDDLLGTYDIVWGEMREVNGKKERKYPKTQGGKEDGARTANKVSPVKPQASNNARRSSRFLGSIGGKALTEQLKKLGVTDEASESNAPATGAGTAGVGAITDAERASVAARGGGLMRRGSNAGTPKTLPSILDGEAQAAVVWVPLEIVLHPSDQEARRLGKDLVQRWGCYEPDPTTGLVKTIQRKITPPPKEGELFIFPEPPPEKVKK